jgi:hypothetical protein
MAKAPRPARSLQSRGAFRTSSPLQSGELKRWWVIAVSLRKRACPASKPSSANPCILPRSDLRFGASCSAILIDASMSGLGACWRFGGPAAAMLAGPLAATVAADFVLMPS